MFKGHPTSIHNQVRFCDTGWKRITRYSRHLVANADTMDYQPVGNVVVGGAARNAESRVIISKIEDILENIVDALNENRVLTIPLRNRRSGNERLIRFPANTDAEVKRFTCTLQILHMCHEALVSGHVVTKRNIYYQNPDLFGSQQYVDTLVDDVAFTFGTGRDALNIVAASKGLVAGKVIISLKDDAMLDCSADHNGSLIPQTEGVRHINIGETKWVMVIEKEATFRGLAASRYHEISAGGIGILVTGKGYPDLATRQFLHHFHSAFSQIPIYALVDFDPSGIDIMLTYKRGSQSLGHEENVTVPSLTWLGPKSCDVLNLTQGRLTATYSSQEDPPSSADQSPSSSPSGHALSANAFGVTSSLTTSDRRKATNLMRKLHGEQSQGAGEIELVYQLQLMLMLNLKAEIQAVDEAGDMTQWLDRKLSSHLR
ncbi:DNA topoisomerase IV, alpha subunit [Hypoxylon fuscum]|nr:DNA topoisomerase IV, alpha subunit [Hypoxylon fuscum]